MFEIIVNVQLLNDHFFILDTHFLFLLGDDEEENEN